MMALAAQCVDGERLTRDKLLSLVLVNLQTCS